MNVFWWRKKKSAESDARQPEEGAVAAKRESIDAATVLLQLLDAGDVGASLQILDLHLEEIQRQGQEETACKLIIQAEETLGEGDHPIAVKALLGNVYQRLGRGDRRFNLERALELYRETEADYGSAGERQGRAIVLNNMGATCLELAAYERSYYQQAIPYLEEALAFYEEEDEFSYRASIYMILGECYLGLEEPGPDHFEMARDYCERAWALFERDQVRDELAAAQGRLGDVQVALGAFNGEKSLEKAVRHYRNALSVYVEGDLQERIAHYQRKLAETYIALSNMESEHLRKGMRAYERALEVYEAMGEEGAAADICLELARLNLLLEAENEDLHLAAAVDLYLKALKTFQKEERQAEQGITLQALGRIYLRAGEASDPQDVRQAICCLQEAGRIYREADLRAENQVVREELVAVHQLFGDSSTY